MTSFHFRHAEALRHIKLTTIVVFFRFETTSSVLTHAIFEMSHQPEIQDRLIKEVNGQIAGIDRDNNLEQYCDAILNNTPFLDSVIKVTFFLDL